MPIVNAFRRKRNLGFALSSRANPELDYARMRRRFPGTYSKFGKAFLSSFPHAFFRGKTGTFLVDLRRSEWEAPMQVAIVTKRNEHVGKGKLELVEANVFTVKLDFSQGTVKIVGLQGGADISRQLMDFESIVHSHAANFLVNLIEKHAKKHGYKRIKIIKVAKNPHAKTVMPFQEDRLVERTTRGRELLNKESNEYNKGKKRGDGLTKAEKDELKKLRKQTEQEILERRRKMYRETATSLGYAEGKNWFEKTL